MNTASPRTERLRDFFDTIHTLRSRNDLTHGMHPYPAKFISQLPYELLSAYGMAGRPVLDPMCGSGTTLVEATVGGFGAVGIDINPIATLVASAKTSVPDDQSVAILRDLVVRLDALAKEPLSDLPPVDTPQFTNRDKWFLHHVLNELIVAKSLVLREPVSVWPIALASLSSIIVGVSNQESETRWCAKPRTIRPGETLHRMALQLAGNIQRAEAYRQRSVAGAMVVRADARNVPIGTGEIGTIITSPPYANSHDYYLYNKLRMFVLGFDVSTTQAAEIGSRNRHSDRKEPVETYLAAMGSALSEWRRVLMEGGRMCVVVADAVVRGELFDMALVFQKLAADAGFESEATFSFNHRPLNALFPRGFGTRLEKRTHVLIFR